MAGKKWVMLENNPEVMTTLALKLGLSPSLQFYDVYSLSDPSCLSHIPRPALALLVIIPLTPAWDADRQSEDANIPPYAGLGPDEPVVWFKQTIGNACGSIGLLHLAINGPAKEYIAPGSTLARLREEAIPLARGERAQMLYDSEEFELAHRAVEMRGDSEVEAATREGGHFVSFVKSGGRLWELEGGRMGPLDRGELGEEEDVLSPRALERGIGRIIGLSGEGGGKSLRFSCIALARKE